MAGLFPAITKRIGTVGIYVQEKRQQQSKKMERPSDSFSAAHRQLFIYVLSTATAQTESHTHTQPHTYLLSQDQGCIQHLLLS